MKDSNDLKLKAPKRFDGKRVQLDLKQLFLKLGECVADASLMLAGRPDAATNLVTAIFGAIDAIDIRDPAELRIWRLVQRATVRSLSEFTVELATSRPITGWDKERLTEIAEVKVNAASLRIDRNFFRDPGASPIVTVVKRHLVGWLGAMGLDSKEAESMATRLPSYFALSLHSEWGANKVYYQPVFDALETPFSDAIQMDEDWERNRLSLIAQFDKPVFGEIFSLRQIYVPLRATHKVPSQLQGMTGGRSTHQQRRVVDLAAAVMSWFSSVRSDNAICLVRGDPGSGKSTFVKAFAEKLAQANEHRVLYIPLQRFLLSERLDNAMSAYLENTQMFARSPFGQAGFASLDTNLLLIFDGLDELAKPGELAEREARKFLGELRTTLAQWNLAGCRVAAIVAGRTPIIQASADAVRVSADQEFDVLRFFLPPGEHYNLEDPDDLLAIDQRQLWWQRYAGLKADVSKKMPSTLLSEELSELSSGPLLIYLLVLSGYHRELSGIGQLNRNEIYRRLLAAVQERKYESSPAPIHHTLTAAEFAEVMESVATAAWYGDGSTATLEDVVGNASDRLKRLIDKVIANAGFYRLIAAFYFRAAEGASAHVDEAFEFTHKSFGEYLTARRIVRAIREIHEGVSMGRDFFTYKNGLEQWLQLCSPRAVDGELARFIDDEIRMPEWRELLPLWQQTLAGMLQYSLDTGVLCTTLGSLSLRTAESRSRNADETLLVALAACAKGTRNVTTIKWQTVHSAGAFMQRLRGQKYLGGDSVTLGCLCYLDLSGQVLMANDLCSANFEGSILVGADFMSSDIRSASFKNCYMRGASLENVTLDRAIFDGADLQEASMNFARQLQDPLRDENFFGNSFVGANLQDALLIHADLRGANFSRASLQNADMRGAHLQGTDFSEADLTNADWFGAMLNAARPAEMLERVALEADFEESGERDFMFDSDGPWTSEFQESEFQEDD